MRELWRKINQLIEQKEAFVLSTIIAGHGSTPRGVGARMVVKQDGSIIGTIGGGAIEYQAGLLALEVLKEKKSYSRGFKLSRDQIAGLGMICGGDVVVYFQYVDSQNAEFQTINKKILEICEKEEDSWLITDITDETMWDMGVYSMSQGIYGINESILEWSDQLFTNKAVMMKLDGKTYYSEPLVKAGNVYIFGGGHVAQELVPVLSHLGFPCVVYDDREEFTSPLVFPQAKNTILADFEDISKHVTITKHDYVVIMTRGHQYDYLIQKQVLGTEAGYIGVMGSRNKIKIISEKLKQDGFCSDDILRFHTPIGTDIQAETPAEIAISIAGELIYTRALKGK